MKKVLLIFGAALFFVAYVIGGSGSSDDGVDCPNIDPMYTCDPPPPPPPPMPL